MADMNKRKLKILGEPWLHDSQSPYIVTTHPASENATVQSLMLQDLTKNEQFLGSAMCCGKDETSWHKKEESCQ